MGQYSYAWKGVYFFLSHGELVRFAACPILSSFIFSVVSVILLFSLALYPQAIGLANVMPTWSAWLVSVSLVVTESFFASFVFGLIAFRNVQKKIFMKTLELKGVNLRGNSNCCKEVTCNSGEHASFISPWIIQISPTQLNCVDATSLQDSYLLSCS